MMQNMPIVHYWMISPLQLSLFGSQLAGYRFFEILESLRSHGKERLAALEVFHYCMLLGFHGKFRIEFIQNLSHLIARVGDEISFNNASSSKLMLCLSHIFDNIF